MSEQGTAARLWSVVEPYLAAESVELDDVELRGRGPGRVVKIVVDAEGGVDVDRIARLSQSISRLLDDEPSLDGPYTLEVSSPGLERELRRPRHYQKSIGRQVKLKTQDAVGGETIHEGVLAAADETALVLDVAGSERHITYHQVASARTVFHWERGQRPGRG